MTDSKIHYAPATMPCSDASPEPASLQAAIDDFNLVFEYDLRLPILPEHVETAADMAAMRGRQDIADGLRSALKVSQTCEGYQATDA